MNDKEKIEYVINNVDGFEIYHYTALDNTIKLTLQTAINEKVNLSRAIFKTIGDALNLDGVDLTHGKMNGCVFNDCSMVGIKFNGTRCLSARLTYVNMDKADIKNQELIDWRFKDSKLTNIDFGTLDLTDCCFDGVDFTNSDLSKATYKIIQFDNCYMDNVKLNPNPDSSELVECGKKIKPVDITNPN